jgi:hypothetical protein
MVYMFIAVALFVVVVVLVSTTRSTGRRAEVRRINRETDAVFDRMMAEAARAVAQRRAVRRAHRPYSEPRADWWLR